MNISGATAYAYKVSGTSFDDVAEFYNSGVEDDGWTVEEHAALGEMMIALLHQDDEMALVTAMTGSAAKADGADLADLDLDLDDLADDDILIVAATFTCDEDNLEDCITAMSLGL